MKFNCTSLAKTLLVSLGLGLIASASADDAQWYFQAAVSKTDTNKIYSPLGYDLKRETLTPEIGNRYFSAGVILAHYTIYGLGNKHFKMPYIEGKLDEDISSSVAIRGSLKYGMGHETQFHFKRNYDINADLYLHTKINEDFALDTGVKAQMSFVMKEAFPHLVLYYRDEKDRGLSFKIGYPYDSITYRFNDEYALTLEVTGLKCTADLRDGSVFTTKAYVIPYALPVSFLIDDSLIGDLKLTYNPTENWNIELGAGYTFHHYVKMYDEDGSQLASLKVKNGVIGYLRARYTF